MIKRNRENKRFEIKMKLLFFFSSRHFFDRLQLVHYFIKLRGQSKVLNLTSLSSHSLESITGKKTFFVWPLRDINLTDELCMEF